MKKFSFLQSWSYVQKVKLKGRTFEMVQKLKRVNRRALDVGSEVFFL